MTTTERLYQLIQTLPEEQINQILYFAESLQQKQHNPPQAIPLGTLTGLRGIAKRANSTPTNQELRPFGLCAGEFVVPDDFDAPLPEDMLNAFGSHANHNHLRRQEHE